MKVVQFRHQRSDNTWGQWRPIEETAVWTAPFGRPWTRIEFRTVEQCPECGKAPNEP